MSTFRCVLASILVISVFNIKGQQITNKNIDSCRIINLDEVVISANKVEESRRNVAQQLRIIRSSQINFIQPQNSADIVAQYPDVFVQKSQMGGGSPVMRGFEASRILLVVDGVRMNNLIYRSGHLQNIITIDPLMLDKVEVLYGPSSTVYGSDALGGVIHFYTRNPEFAKGSENLKTELKASTRYSSANNEFSGHIDLNAGTEKFASLTSFTYSKFDDLKGGKNQNPFYNKSYGERPYYVKRINGKDSLVKNSDRYLQKQSGYTQYDIVQKISFKQNGRVRHTLNLQYSNSTDIPRYDRLTDASGNGLKYAEWYYGPQLRLLGAYEAEIVNSNSFFQRKHALIAYQYLEESRHTRKFGKNLLSHRTEKVNVATINIDMQHKTIKHDLRTGLDIQSDNLKSTAEEENIVTGTSNPLDTRYPDGDNYMNSISAYVSHSWKINNQNMLTEGVRAGYSMLHSTFVDTSFFHLPFTEADQNNFVYSGSIGLVNTPSDDLKISLLLSTGYHVPNVDELSKVFESSPGSVIVPNPDLEPERTVNAEIGITRIFSKKSSWENMLYYTDFTNAIVTDVFTYNGKDSIIYDGSMSRVYANQNKKHAYIYGISSEFATQCADNLGMSIGMSYTYGRIKTDSTDAPLDHIPPFMMHLSLTYNVKKFASEFFVNYNGWKRLKDYNTGGEDNEVYATDEGMPAWVTLNLRASYMIHSKVKIVAGVDNLLDTQYRVFASGINSPGRNIYASLIFNP